MSFWSWWTAGSYQRGAFRKIYVQGGRSRPPSLLHDSGSWTCRDYSKSPSQHNWWHTAVCPCPWRWQCARWWWMEEVRMSWCSDLRSWVRMVPRKRRESTETDSGWWGFILPEFHNHLHCVKTTELQVILTAPVHQMVNLRWAKFNEGGVICKAWRTDDWGCRCSPRHFFTGE